MDVYTTLTAFMEWLSLNSAESETYYQLVIRASQDPVSPQDQRALDDYLAAHLPEAKANVIRQSISDRSSKPVDDVVTLEQTGRIRASFIGHSVIW
jgi:hypothetical protein